MWTRHRRPRRLYRLVVPALCAAAVAYFNHHGIEGRYGLNAMARYDARIAALQLELDALEAHSAFLARRIALVEAGRLERDMLDELARRQLGYTRPNEIVMLHSSN